MNPRRRRTLGALGALVLTVAVTTSTRAGATAATAPKLVNLPYNIYFGSYLPTAGGHDAHSYWIWYHDARNSAVRDYAVVIAVPDGLPKSFAFALPKRAKPHVNPSDHSKVIVIGRSLDSGARALIREGVLPETRSAFFELAASDSHVDVDQRKLTTPGMSVTIVAKTIGSLAEGLDYELSWGPGLLNGWGQTPLPLLGTLSCHEYPNNRALVFFELPGVTRFSLAEDGNAVIANHALAHDPIQPAVAAYALFMPQTVHTITVTTQPSGHGFSINLQDCENRD